MAQIPRPLRKQLKQYEAAGFTLKEAQPTKKHWKVRFHEFPQFQILTINEGDWHGVHNNLARFKRLAAQKV